MPGRRQCGWTFDAGKALFLHMTSEFHRFAPTDADWLVARHGDLYALDEGFDASFPDLVRQILDAFVAHHDPATEGGWILWQDDRRIGSVFVVRESSDTAKLRLVLLEPEARGLGLGQRLLDQAIGFARAAGYRRMRLWTHESQRAAGRLYARNGFDFVASEPRQSFGCDVVAQYWERGI
jgi:GNAT superfamily N-acetyltransferase